MSTSQSLAERMQAIREWVRQGAVPDASHPSPVNMTMVTDLNRLQDRVAGVQASKTVHEQPFVSHAPLFGRLLVFIRTAWNWMSTKWYVLPLVHQQNNFNARVTEAWSESLRYLKNLGLLVHYIHRRLDDLEERLDQAVKVQMTGRESSSASQPAAVDVADIVEAALADWDNLFAAGPVLVLSCGRGETVRALAERGRDVSGVESNPTRVQQCAGNGLNVVHANDIEHLTSLPDGGLSGVLAVWHSPLSMQHAVSLLDQCRRVSSAGAWTVWVWPWAATLDEANAHVARNIALGMGFRNVRLQAHQHADMAFQTLSLQK